MADNTKLHIVMFPWLGFGHMIPYLELSKLVAEKGHKISFISTPRNIDRLPKHLPPHLSSLINFVKLPLPPTDNLPENAESTFDLPKDKVKYLMLAYDGLREPFTQFLENCSPGPDWVFHDFAPYWLGPVAVKLKIPTAFFSIFFPALLVFYAPPEHAPKKLEEFIVPSKWVPLQSKDGLRMFEITRTSNDHATNRFRLNRTIRGCDVIVVRGCVEFEPEWFELVETIYEKPIIPVGQLPPMVYDDDEKGNEWKVMKDWLDTQGKGSVVYVAFGSECNPSQLELTEIALGLELSGLPFLWVLREHQGLTHTELTQLPDGFEERTKGRGVVWTSWVPQLKILSHDSVGASLTHCGWSSVVEAVQLGIPLIFLSLVDDQGLTGRFLEEKKMGYLVPWEKQNGLFTRNSVADSLRLVMVEAQGKIYRDKVKEMSRVFGDREKQNNYVDNLLSHLSTHPKMKSRK